jgi:hypothetical protein
MMRICFLLMLCVGHVARGESAAFWNGYAKQFIFAPAFDFKPVAGATCYRFTIGDQSFESPDPRAALTPIWSKVPVGTAKLRVEGLKEPGGDVVGVAVRPELESNR